MNKDYLLNISQENAHLKIFNSFYVNMNELPEGITEGELLDKIFEKMNSANKEKLVDKIKDKFEMNDAKVGVIYLGITLSALLAIPVIYYFINKNLKRQN